MFFLCRPFMIWAILLWMLNRPLQTAFKCSWECDYLHISWTGSSSTPLLAWLFHFHSIMLLKYAASQLSFSGSESALVLATCITTARNHRLSNKNVISILEITSPSANVNTTMITINSNAHYYFSINIEQMWQPCQTPFLVSNLSVTPFAVLTTLPCPWEKWHKLTICAAKQHTVFTQIYA